MVTKVFPFRPWQDAILGLLLGFWSIFPITAHSTSGRFSWSCTEPEWIAVPQFEEGILVGRLGSTCHLSGVPKGGIGRLFAFIQSDVQGSSRYTLHRPAVSMMREGIQGFQYDLTDTIEEEEGSISIRQDMFLGLQRDTRLLYQTESTEVKANGKAGALKKVVFRTELTPSSVHFENKVHLERPWYAFPPILFRTVGKGIIQDKFVIARDKLLHYFAPHL
jgi:hypothetical protein